MKIYVFEIKLLGDRSPEVGGNSSFIENIEATKLHTALHRLGERLEKIEGANGFRLPSSYHMTIKLVRIERRVKTHG